MTLPTCGSGAPDLERLLAECEAGGGAKKMVGVLRRIGRDIGAKDGMGDSKAEGDPGKLTLVGAVFITGREDDMHGIGKFS